MRCRDITRRCYYEILLLNIQRMKKINYNISLVLLCFFTFFSCDFGDTNINPALPSDVSAQAIIPAAQAGMAFAIGGEMVRINGLFMQQFEGVNAQQLDNYNYLVKSSDMDGVWRRTYASALNPLITILRKAEDEDSRHTAAMVEILMAHSIGSLTDMFGDVPYTDALQALDNNFFPSYDRQQDIYPEIQRLLDDAIAKLTGDGGSGIALGGEDLMYAGDVEAWTKIARSLKAKYYLRTSKVDADAYSNALGALTAGIASNDDDFQFVFGSAANEANPQFQFTQDRAGNMEMDQFFVDLLEARNDPRRDLFVADEKDFDRDGFYTSINSPVVYMSYAEVKFIEAEAALMGNNDVAAAETALREAIEASLSKITGVIDEDYVNTYANFDGLTTENERLERIMTEKYIALYSNGLEAWTDFRRTGFPDITPNPMGSNAFNLSGDVPRRLPYPQTEIDLNPTNVPTNAPNFQDRFWWDE